MQPALIQPTACLVLEFRIQTTQGYKIKRAVALYMAIMMRYQFIKTAKNVFIVHV